MRLSWFDIKYFSGASETATKKAPEICCKAMTVDCSACAKGQTIEEYCEDEENKEKPGCEGRNLQLLLAM